MDPDRDLLMKLKLENEDVYGVMVTKALDNVCLNIIF